MVGTASLGRPSLRVATVAASSPTAALMEHNIVASVVALLKTSVALNARAIHTTLLTFPDDLIFLENPSTYERLIHIVV
jgi:pyruvate/2-oxoacid:ferredoxin oxidoreductase alpha subunit